MTRTLQLTDSEWVLLRDILRQMSESAPAVLDPDKFCVEFRFNAPDRMDFKQLIRKMDGLKNENPPPFTYP